MDTSDLRTRVLCASGWRSSMRILVSHLDRGGAMTLERHDSRLCVSVGSKLNKLTGESVDG